MFLYITVIWISVLLIPCCDILSCSHSHGVIKTSVCLLQVVINIYWLFTTSASCTWYKQLCKCHAYISTTKSVTGHSSWKLPHYYVVYLLNFDIFFNLLSRHLCLNTFQNICYHLYRHIYRKLSVTQNLLPEEEFCVSGLGQIRWRITCVFHSFAIHSHKKLFFREHIWRHRLLSK